MSSSLQDPSLYIRPACKEDASSLSRICLLTADAGKSAESLHAISELPGLIFATPYVHLPYTTGFVLVRRKNSDNDKSTEEEVIGYTATTYDSKEFQTIAEQEWYPSYCKKYPKPSENPEYYKALAISDQDKRFIALLHAPEQVPETCLKFCPAHMHINILPEAQKQGWGRKLVGSIVKYLCDEEGMNRVWLGIDPRNVNAAQFYTKLGFKPIEGAPSNYFGLSFDDFIFST